VEGDHFYLNYWAKLTLLKRKRLFSIVFKLCTKFERNRIIHGLVIDDLARFRVQLYGCVTTDRPFSWVRGPKLQFGYLAAFSNAGGSKLSKVLNDAKFRTFLPPPCEN